jgi:hypothetical protein
MTQPKPAAAVFELPDATDLESVNLAEIEVIRLATRGVLKPRDALRYTRMLEHRRRAIASRTFEVKMDEINQRLKQRSGS